MFPFASFIIDCAVNHRAQMINEIREDIKKFRKSK